MPQDRSDALPPQGRRPSDTEQLVGETAASEPLTDAEPVQPAEATARQVGGARDAGLSAPGARDSGAQGRVPLDGEADREAELGHS